MANYSNIKHLPLPEGVTYNEEKDRYIHKNRAICAALLVRNGVERICLKFAKSNGRCTIHGGNNAKGQDHYKFKSGLYSKYIPKDILPRYDEAINDADLVSLRQNLALTDVRLSQLLERLDTGDTPGYWKRLHSWYKKFQSIPEHQQDKRLEALDELPQIIEAAQNDHATWKEIHQTSEEKRKLAESERRRLLDMQQYITVERAMILMSAVVEIVRQHVTDQEALASVSDGVRRLITAESSRPVASANRSTSDSTSTE